MPDFSVRFQPSDGPARLFADPVSVIRAETRHAVAPALQAMDRALRTGHWIAGWIGYEAGAGLEPVLPPPPPGRLLAIGVFPGPRDAPAIPDAPSGITAITGWPDRAGFMRDVETLLGAIRRGEVYQVNLTQPVAMRLTGTPEALFARLSAAQPTPYGALIRDGAGAILSASPELFFRVDPAGRITARPMKGTSGRGSCPASDARARAALQADPKNRAENLMIVDLLRNDLGRIAETGSVTVPGMFAIETHATLHQMTSTVTAQLKQDWHLSDLLAAMFPCGSVTGAPKIAAMQKIAALEARRRGPYCGAIGWAAPDGQAQFSVAIRTLEMPGDGTARLGIGAGIVADSDPAAEYREITTKARFVTDLDGPPALIETMIWRPGEGIWLLDEHLARLAASAAALGYLHDAGAVAEALAALTDPLPAQPHRLRLTLAPDGGLTSTATALGDQATRAQRLCLSPHPITAGDLWRRHKTTHRALYDREQARAAAAGFDEVLFVNEFGRLAEGSRTNLFVERGGVLLTPPVSEGALPGTLRARLLAEGRAVERVLTGQDLTNGRVHVGNSVRGLLQAENDLQLLADQAILPA